MEQRWNGLDGCSHSFGRKVRSHKFIVGILFVVLTIILVSAASEAQTTKPWVTAYYGGWELGDGGNGYLPVSDVDFTADHGCGSLLLSAQSRRHIRFNGQRNKPCWFSGVSKSSPRGGDEGANFRRRGVHGAWICRSHEQ